MAIRYVLQESYNGPCYLGEGVVASFASWSLKEVLNTVFIKNDKNTFGKAIKHIAGVVGPHFEVITQFSVNLQRAGKSYAAICDVRKIPETLRNGFFEVKSWVKDVPSSLEALQIIAKLVGSVARGIKFPNALANKKSSDLTELVIDITDFTNASIGFCHSLSTLIQNWKHYCAFVPSNGSADIGTYDKAVRNTVWYARLYSGCSVISNLSGGVMPAAKLMVKCSIRQKEADSFWYVLLYTSSFVGSIFEVIAMNHQNAIKKAGYTFSKGSLFTKSSFDRWVASPPLR